MRVCMERALSKHINFSLSLIESGKININKVAQVSRDTLYESVYFIPPLVRRGGFARICPWDIPRRRQTQALPRSCSRYLPGYCHHGCLLPLSPLYWHQLQQKRMMPQRWMNSSLPSYSQLWLKSTTHPSCHQSPHPHSPQYCHGRCTCC